MTGRGRANRKGTASLLFTRFNSIEFENIVSFFGRGPRSKKKEVWIHELAPDRTSRSLDGMWFLEAENTTKIKQAVQPICVLFVLLS